MKKTSYILALLTAASALLLSGCAKEMDVNGDGAALRFSTNSLEIVSTKAAGEALTGTAAATNRTMNLYSDGKLSDMTLELEESVNTEGLAAATKAAEITGDLTTFTVAGFDGTTGDKWFPESAASQEVTTGTTYNTYKWKSNKAYQFFGYANLPASSSVASAAITSDGVTLTYTAVPESATDQKDILLGASYENVPAEGKANMTFYHPLAEVVFKLESSSFGGTSVKVTGITLDGVYKSGTVVCNDDDSPYEDEDYFKFTWTDTSSKGTVSQTQTDASGITLSDGVIGVPFMLIPQAFTSGASLTVIVDLEIDGAAKSFTATLDDITWNSGKKYVYTIKKMVKELVISSLADLNAFKAQIESPIGSGGKDYSGYTIYLGGTIEITEYGYEFISIYDQYGRLNGTTIDGMGKSIKATSEGIKFTPNNNDPNGTVGLFSTLTSDNVTLKNIRFENITSAGSGASFIAGTYKGSQITIDNCQISDCISTNPTSTVTGSFIGICKGNAIIKNCRVQGLMIQCYGYETSPIIGEAVGGIKIDIESVEITAQFYSTAKRRAFGFYVGKCTNYTGMKITIKDCVSDQCTYMIDYWDVSDYNYKHTGTGKIDEVDVVSPHHFYAVAWYDSGDGIGLTVNMSGMSLSNLLYY